MLPYYSPKGAIMIEVKKIMFVAVVFALALLATTVSVLVTGKDDAPLEELAEDVLKAETGIDVDLTPNSPEKA